MYGTNSTPGGMLAATGGSGAAGVSGAMWGMHTAAVVLLAFMVIFLLLVIAKTAQRARVVARNQ